MSCFKGTRQFGGKDMTLSLTGLATLFIIAVYFWTLMQTGMARGKYNIQAPAVSGNPDFERVFRVQNNTLEQIVLFVPVLWVFALFYPHGNGDCIAAVTGFVFGVSRIIYALGYYNEAGKRTTGFMIGFVTFIATFMGALYGVIASLG
ncbi:MAG: MAPEG family protein [Parvibaculales bacterium]